MKFLIALLASLCVFFCAQAQTHIHIDQIGYTPQMEKVAVISNPITGYNSSESYTPGSTIEVINTEDGTVAYSGAPVSWQGGATHAQSGDQGWWFDFSSVNVPGEYYLYDVATGGTSHVFEINDDVYSELLQATQRMFYYNRCGHDKAAPFTESGWTDGMNFNNAGQDTQCTDIYDQGNMATAKDLSGGWFDAGDFNKYVTFVDGAMHDLLWAYQENPDVFLDNFNIPESGNGIPDLLDEIKWELDWLMKMNNLDGSTHIKMGSKNHSENSQSPPSACVDPRYYGPTCTSAALSVAGVFAHAAKVYEQIPDCQLFAAELESRAVTTWDYVLPFVLAGTLDLNCDDLSIVAGDADVSYSGQLHMALTAAIHLLDLTGDSQYNDYVIAHLFDAEPVSAPFWGVYTIALEDALLHYSALPTSDPTTALTITDSFTTDVTNNWNGYFGFNDADLYRAYMPDWSYHWGSSRPKAYYGILNKLINKYNLVPGNATSFDNQAAGIAHYFHGVNSLGMIQLSNMSSLGGEVSCNEIYHQWFQDGNALWDDVESSTYGPVPGFVTGGPNKDFSVGSISPPSGQPIQKSYLDWNAGWPENSWEITEPSVSYQACYLRLLANFVSHAQACPTDYNSDGQIDTSDLLEFLTEFGCVSNCSKDLTGDDVVNTSDLLTFLESFGTFCP